MIEVCAKNDRSEFKPSNLLWTEGAELFDNSQDGEGWHSPCWNEMRRLIIISTVRTLSSSSSKRGNQVVTENGSKKQKAADDS